MTRDRENDDIWSLEGDEWKFIIEHFTSSNSIIKFDANGDPKGSNLIWFFWKGLNL